LKKKLSEETDSDKRDMYQRMLTKVTTAIGTASAAVDGPSTLEDAARQVTLLGFYICICDIACG